MEAIKLLIKWKMKRPNKRWWTILTHDTCELVIVRLIEAPPHGWLGEREEAGWCIDVTEYLTSGGKPLVAAIRKVIGMLAKRPRHKPGDKPSPRPSFARGDDPDSLNHIADRMANRLTGFARLRPIGAGR